MRYIKWFYLAAVWLIYQLPKRSVLIFSSLIIVVTVLLFSWLLVSPHFVVGTVKSSSGLPGNRKTVIEVGIPKTGFAKLAVIDSAKAPLPQKTAWFLGYGESLYSLNERSILVLDNHTYFVAMPFMELMDSSRLFEFLKGYPRGALLAGILLLIFGMLAIQILTAAKMGLITMILAWHLLIVGNYLEFWLLSDLLVYPLSIIAAVAGAALGMRTDFGWVARVFHRISAIVLLLLFMPLLTHQLQLADSTTLSWSGIIAVVFFPQLAYISGGAALITYSLALTPSETIVILLSCLCVVLWLQRRRFWRVRRPFHGHQTATHGEMQLNNLMVGEES